MPSAPPVIFTPPSPSAPGAAPGIFEPAPAGKGVLLVSGVSTALVNGLFYYAGRNDNSPAWSRDGTLVHSTINPIIFETSGIWFVQLNNGSVYGATKTNAAATPEGLTSWLVSTGTGQPTIAVSALAVPAAITA